MKKKVIICFFGVVSRSIKYTHKKLESKIINVVKKKYDIDIYVFNNNVEGACVDNIPQNNNDVKLLKTTYFEEKCQSDIDKDIEHKIITENIDTTINNHTDKTCYSQKITQNCLRQFYSENMVATFLEKNINNYDCAIVCCTDYYLKNKINLEHIEKSIGNNSLVYTTNVWDSFGYTNGFYIGSLEPMIKILNRYCILKLLLPNKYNYEYILKESFIINKINREITTTMFLKIRSNKKVKLSRRTPPPGVINHHKKYTKWINTVSKEIKLF